MQCTVCGHPANNVVFNARRFTVVECDTCHFGQVAPLPEVEALAAMYNSAEYFATHMHYDYDQITQPEIDKQVRQAGQLHGALLGPYLNGAKSLLEIGPGGGFALKHFAQRGLRVRGVETSDASSAFMRQRLGLDVVNAMLETYPEDGEQWDVVMLNHVLEHFLDLHAAMRRLAALVATGGLLYVRVPNHHSYDRVQAGAAWPAYVPYHISYFSEASLRLLFAQYGFDVVATSSFVSDQFLHQMPGPIRQLGIRALNFLGLQGRFKGRTIAIVGRKK